MQYTELSIEDALAKLQTGAEGLLSGEAAKRLLRYGPNQLQESRINSLKILWRQITGNPLSLILVAAAIVSFFTDDHNTAYYVTAMVLVSVLLGFWNEFSAERTVATLLGKISLTAVVLRDKEREELPVTNLTLGDIVLLSPGTIIPADLRLIQSESLEINEAVLTGESAPREKDATKVICTKDLSGQINAAFMGTEVVSGFGTGVVVGIGKQTEFGKVAQITSFVRPPTQFQAGLSGFGNLIVKVIFLLTLVIFGVNTFLGRDPLTALLFALAVAVGLTPELLPVVVTVGLSRGAGKLAKHQVITKQLIAIENLGNMDVLCTDKTGTLTEGRITVTSQLDAEGKEAPHLLDLALLCNGAVVHHRIVGNSIDTALWQHAQAKRYHPSRVYKKIFEEPFDFTRQFMFSVIQKGDERRLLIVKGAPERVLEHCEPGNRRELLRRFLDLSHQGLRVIALASRPIAKKAIYKWEDAGQLRFQGFITFSDVPKPSSKQALEHLHRLNVSVKVITGDNEIVARTICEKVGMEITGILTGEELAKKSGKALQEAVQQANVFSRVSPEQKLLVISTLRELGRTVGYLGDGVNDAPSLHCADIGISVNTAVDVAKEAAQVVLLRKGLDVIAAGIQEGRRTFMNTIKYILMGTGSNFGEVISAAGASFVLPFLPMTPAQILLENGLYDASQVPLTTDRVDEELLQKPKHWDIRLIYHFMFFFGALSAFYSVITYLILLWGFHAQAGYFQAALFIECLLTEMVVVLVVRTVRVPFYRSLPSLWFGLGILLITILGVWLPFSPLADSLGFIRPDGAFLLVLALLVLSYIGVVEVVKKIFLNRFSL